MKLYRAFYKMFGMHMHGENRSYYSNVPAETLKAWFINLEHQYTIELWRRNIICLMIGGLITLVLIKVMW